MGDRRIAILHFSEEYGADVAVYTHWSGYTLEDEVRAIAASPAFRSRVGDEVYAARIMIDQITKDARDEETGYGVFPLMRGSDPLRFAESEYPIVHVDLQTGEVTA
jgi:hypothetical protein